MREKGLASTNFERKNRLLAHLMNMRLEQAVAMQKEAPVPLQRSDVKTVLDAMLENRYRARESGYIGEVDRWSRRIYAIRGFRDYGPDPDRMINQVLLPEGYDGKILLVKIAGGVVASMTCLRSGDDWHRTILTNAREEIADLGFNRCTVHELGGCSVTFQQSGAVTIWGTSEDFGACDKGYAAALISKAYPERNVIVADD